MARFLFCVWPARGHLYPTLPILRALQARDHDVAVVTVPQFNHLFAPYDIPTYPLSTEAPCPAEPHSGQLDAQGSGAAALLFRRLFVDPAPAMARAVGAAAQAFGPDVLVHDQRSYGPTLVAERDNIPLATLCLTCCSLPNPDLAPFGLGLPPARDEETRASYARLRAASERAFLPVKKVWEEMRASFGLPPRDGPLTTTALSSELLLIPAVAALDYARSDLPAYVHYVGPLAWDPPAEVDPATAQWLSSLPADMPLVVAAASTATVAGRPDRRSAALVQAALDGLSGSGVAVLATLPFDHELHERATTLPWGLWSRVVRFTPHTQVLPRAEAVVSHAGFGTVVKTLAHGLPLIAVPFAGDQLEVAQRVVAAGAGIRLNPTDLTPGALHDAVWTVLQAPEYREAAGRLGAALNGRDGPGEAAVLLEQLATRRRVARNTLSYAEVVP